MKSDLVMELKVQNIAYIFIYHHASNIHNTLVTYSGTAMYPMNGMKNRMTTGRHFDKSF